jgi:hypothetical protein
MNRNWSRKYLLLAVLKIVLLTSLSSPVSADNKVVVIPLLGGDNKQSAFDAVVVGGGQVTSDGVLEGAWGEPLIVSQENTNQNQYKIRVGGIRCGSPNLQLFANSIGDPAFVFLDFTVFNCNSNTVDLFIQTRDIEGNAIYVDFNFYLIAPDGVLPPR